MKSHCRVLKRAGFTLLELLIVVAVIAMLLGLLLPNIRTSREAARRMTCSNHLKYLAIAVHNYHDAFDMLPPAAGGTGGDSPMSGNGHRLSGVVALLPFIEQGALWEEIAHELKVGGVAYPPMGPRPDVTDYPPWSRSLLELHCPSATSREEQGGGTNYAFCIGDMARSIHGRSMARGAFVPRSATTLLEAADGLRYTLMFGEMGSRPAAAEIAVAPSPSLLDNPSEAMSLVTGASESFRKDVRRRTVGRGQRWADGAASSSLFNTILPPNSPSVAMQDIDEADGLYSVSSEHPGGVQVAMLDASVHFIGNKIDVGDSSAPAPRSATGPSPYGVWGALGTRDGVDEVGDF